MAHNLAQVLFAPKSVAIVGQSNDAGKTAGRPLKYLRQAGLTPTWIRLAELRIHGNSHVMKHEKNNNEIAAVIHGWLDKALPKIDFSH